MSRGPTLARVTRRAWLIGGMSLVLVAAAAVAYARTRDECGEQVTSLPASQSSSPFLDAEQRSEQPDHDRDRLVTALATAPSPFGDVLGAVGYHYEQWAQVEAFAQGIGVRTRDNPDFTMLDDRTLKPLWSVQVDTKRSTYDASDRRYLVATMPAKASPDLVAIDADNGHRLWCSSLGETSVGPDDPFATQILDDEDVAVLGPAGGGKERLVRLDGKDGSQLWQRTLDADSGDFLGELSPAKLLLGGREQFRLFDPESVADRPAGTALALVSAKDGKTIWTRPAAEGADLHVLGTDSGAAFALDWSTKSGSARLIAIDGDGALKWSVVPAKGEYFDATLAVGADPGAGEGPLVGVRHRGRSPAVVAGAAGQAAAAALRLRAGQHPAARRRPRTARYDDRAAHPRPANRSHDLDGTAADGRDQHHLLALPARRQRRTDRGGDQHRRRRRTPGRRLSLSSVEPVETRRRLSLSKPVVG